VDVVSIFPHLQFLLNVRVPAALALLPGLPPLLGSVLWQRWTAVQACLNVLVGLRNGAWMATASGLGCFSVPTASAKIQPVTQQLCKRLQSHGLFRLSSPVTAKFNSGAKGGLSKKFCELARTLCSLSEEMVPESTTNDAFVTAYYKVGGFDVIVPPGGAGAAAGVVGGRGGSGVRFRLGELDDPLLVVQSFPESVEGCVPPPGCTWRWICGVVRHASWCLHSRACMVACCGVQAAPCRRPTGVR
jgi:hypothetical protein